MGWLKAIGESRLVQDTNQLANTAINLQQLQGQAQHMRALEANQAEQLNLEKQRTTSQLDMQAQQLREAKIKADQLADDNKMIDVHDTLERMGVKSQAEREYYLKHAMPYIDDIGGRPYIKKAQGRTLMVELAKDPQANMDVGNIRLKEHDTAIKSIDQQLQSGKLKPEQQQQLMQQKVALQQQREATANEIVAERNKLLMQNKEKATLMKGEDGNWYNVFPTGEKIMIGKGMTPESVVKEGAKQEFELKKVDRQGEWGMRKAAVKGGGGGKASQVYAGIWKATLSDGSVIDIQKNKAGQFIDIQGNPAPGNIVSVTQAVGTKPAGGRGRLSGTPSSTPQQPVSGKKVVGEGVYLGRKVVKYSDGSVDYAK